MNIEQAKSIPLGAILHILRDRYAQEENKLHSSRTLPSPEVYSDKEGGTLEFVCAYLASQGVSSTIPDGLRWIENMLGYAPSIQPISLPESPIKQKRLVVKARRPITCLSLRRYLDHIGIPLELAKMYLQEVSVQNLDTMKNAVALTSRNEVGGYEIFNKFYTGYIGKPNIGFIRGTVVKPDVIHIFLNIIDYLSAVIYSKEFRFKGDSLILHRFSCLTPATPYIKGYGYKLACTWMPNSKTGKAATRSLNDFFKTEDSLAHHPMNKIYARHGDMHAWHMHNLNSNH